jgi:phosphoserine phosphatase
VKRIDGLVTDKPNTTVALASWNDTPTRAAIAAFVERVTTGQNPVPVDERIAVFDNDGTLWTEKPMPVELVFILQRWTAMAEADPTLREKQPWKAAYERDYAYLAGAIDKHYAGDDSDVKVLLGGVVGAFAGLEVEEYGRQAAAFIRDGHHPTLRRPFAAVGYQPMVELLRYLEANGFTTLIASGGSRDFMRGFAWDVYQIPPERIIGSSNQLQFVEDGDGSLVYAAAPDVFDDGPAKPIRIWSRLGRRPLIAGGNSNGDVPMLSFAGTGDRPGLRLLVLHDDAQREADYVKGAEQALDRARAEGWTVISIKDDWATVFTET